MLLDNSPVSHHFRMPGKNLRTQCIIALVCQSLQLEPLARVTAKDMEQQLREIARAGQQELGALYTRLNRQGTIAPFQEVDISDYQEEFNLNNPVMLTLK